MLIIAFNRAFSEPTSSVIGFDKIVASINEQIITQKDVENDVLLLDRLPLKSALLQTHRKNSSLSSLVLQKQIKQLAGNIALYQPSENAIQRRFWNFALNGTIQEYRSS